MQFPLSGELSKAVDILRELTQNTYTVFVRSISG